MRFATTVFILLLCAHSWADDPALITGRITVFGSKIEVSPAVLETAAGIPIFLNTTGGGLSGKLKGELRGPGINGAITFQTDPGSPFQLPALQTKGTYSFEDIRLENNGQILASASPARVEIRVIDILITQISSRPLSLDEIRSLGIIINENDYTAVSFEVGLQFNGNLIPISFPLLVPKKAGLQPLIPPPVESIRFGNQLSQGPGNNLTGALPNFVPVTFSPTRPDFSATLPDIPGVLVFPNDIAFLNQFFAVVLMVTNGASAGSNLSVDHLTAQMVFDPANLRIAKTNPSVPLGSPVPVRVPGADHQIGTADDLTLIVATNTAKAEFFVEGLQEGTHTVRMNLDATVHGLLQGDVPISGVATGAVLVRNPNFSITFSHPSVVRAFQPYDLFVTITNTSVVDANLVRLTLPSNELVNCVIQGSSYQDFETIRSGESATATFRIDPQITGQVTTAVVTSSNNVKGQFVLRVAVGEKGIPLSPNTLLLPEFANQLGPDLLQKGLNVLGLAYSAATAPPGGLPPGIPYISKAIVTQRALEFALAGQRFQLGEAKSDVLSHLLLDWLGNDVADDGFLYLLRSTQSGTDFLNELFSQLNFGATNAIAFHDSFAQSTSYRDRFLSVMLTSSAPAGFSIADSTGAFPSDRFASADGLAQWALIGDFPDSPDDTLRISGNGGTAELSIVLPVGSTFYHAQTTLSGATGKAYEVFFNNSLAPPDLQIKDEQGAIISIPLTQVQGKLPAIISAVQDSRADRTGHTVALLFNQPVTKQTAETLTNYSLSRNRVIDAKLQMGGRIVYLSFQNPISPFVDNDLFVSGIQTVAGPIQGTARIQTTVTNEAGRVTGRFIASDGTPIPSANVTLSEVDEDDLFGEKTSHVTAVTSTNAQGEFAFDYVRKSNEPFTISAQDPLTGDIGNSSATILFTNQWIRLDVVLLGRGTIKGKVYQRVSGNNVPVVNAIVTALALNERVSREVLTDSAGNYLIDRLSVGTVNLSAHNLNLADPQKLFGATTTAIPLAGSVVTADIEVTSTQPGSVNGRVLQSNGTDPIIGAYVTLAINDQLSFALPSDSQGWFHFDQVPPGAIKLVATDTATSRTIGSATITLAAGANMIVNVVSSGSGSIEAVVTLATGINLTDVVVAVQGTALSQRLSVNNTAIFDGVPVGGWTVLANNTRTGEIVYSSAKVPYAGATSVVSLRFPEKGTISGDIRSVSGQLAPDSTVLLFGGPFLDLLVRVGAADSNGHYLFKDLDFGNYIAHAISPNQNDGGQGPVVKLSTGLRNAVSDVNFLGTGTITVHVETSSGPVMTPVKLNTSTFDYDGRITREITYTKTSDPTTGNAVFANIFRMPFTVEASTALTLPARVGGNLTGPSTTVNILLTPNPNVSGIVHDASGNAVQAQVTYTGASLTQTLTTAPDGTFTFNRIALGDATFTASATSTKGQLRKMIQPVNDPIDIHLLGSGSVHGMIKDADGNPVGGTNITVVVPGLLAQVLQGISSSDGTYRFNAVPEGPFTIEATNGVTGGRAGSSIIHNADIPLDVVLTATGTVQGTLFHSDGVTRVVAAEISLDRLNLQFGTSNTIATVTTDGNGNFLIAHVPVSHSASDAYRLTAFSKSSGRHAASTQFVITSNNQVVNQDMILEGIGILNGIVFDYTGINPIAGSLLTLRSNGVMTQALQASSGASGDFQFAGVPQGSYIVTAQKDLLAGQVTGSITHDGEVKTQNLLLQPAAQIRGVVQFFDGNQVPAGVNPVVTVIGTGVKLFVDAPDGNFLIQDLPFGTYTLTTTFTYANKPYHGRVQVVLNSPGESFAILRLKGLNTIDVSVTGFVPNNPNSITLRYSNDMENRSESVAIPSDGNVQFLNVPESKFTIFAKSGDFLSGSSSGTFTGDGEVRNITIALTTSGTVQGTVYRNNSPAADVTITLTGATYELFAYTDGAGQFTIPGVPIGTYLVSAEDIALGGKARVSDSIDFENDLNTHQLNLDAVNPSVVSTNPSNGQTGVTNDSTIHIVFSEPMDPASTQAAFSLTYAGGKTAGAITLNGNDLTFVPSAPLQPQKTYNIVVASTAEDIAGNPIGTDFIASFTSIDTVPPGITTTLPLNLAFNVPLNTTFQVYFNETVTNRGNYTITRSSGLPATVANEAWNAAHTVLTLQFGAPFGQNERITFSISGYVDSAGNTQTAVTTVVFDTIDTIPPGAPSLSSTDADNKIREGTSVTILAAVAEPLVNVDFFINGALKFHDTSSPFQYSIPASLTTIAANGSNQLAVKASATDRSGNTSPQTPLTIELLPDTPPQVSIATSPQAGNVVAGSIIHVNYSVTDDGTIVKVMVLVTGATNQTIDNGNITTGTTDVTLPGNLTAGSAVFIKVRATDETGKSTTSSSADFTIVADTQAPLVTLTLPDSSVTYQTSQTVIARATATDNSRVAYVEFYGTYTDAQNQPVTLLLGNDTTASGSTFEVNFDFPRTSTLTIFAKAYDPSGNSATSASRTLHANLNAYPVVSFVDPISGAEVIQKTTITLTATATDSDGSVASVKFYSIIGGSETLIDQDLSGPTYSVNYTVPQSVTSITLKALATDNLGDTAFTTVSVTAVPDPKATVTGRVLNIDSAPVANATAQLFINSISIAMATTNASGQYSFGNISTIDGNYIVKVVDASGVGETNSAKPVTPTTNMPDIVLRTLVSKALPGLTSQAVSAVKWYDAAAEKKDPNIGFDSAWRFGVLQTVGQIGNAEHIHLTGRVAAGFTADGWTLQIVNNSGSLVARLTKGANTTDVPLTSAATPLLFGTTNTGLTLQFDAGVNWQAGDTYKLASWYVEPLSSARGGTQNFPAQAIILATIKEVNIYDASNDALWMKFNVGLCCSNNMIYTILNTGFSQSESPILTIDSLAGKLYMGHATSPLNVVSFRTDSAYRYGANYAGGAVQSSAIYNGSISLRNSGLNFTGSGLYPMLSCFGGPKTIDAERIGDGVWIATSGGCLQTLRENSTATQWSACSGSATAIAWVASGALWNASGKDLRRSLPDCSQSTVFHTDTTTGLIYRDIQADDDFVYLATNIRGIDVYDTSTGQYTAGVFNVPSTLAGTSKDVREMAGNALRLWAVTAAVSPTVGALSALDTFSRQLAASFSSPTTPSNDLESLDQGSTAGVPVNLIVGSNNAGAAHIKGDYQNLGATNGLVVLPGKQNPASRTVNRGDITSVLQFDLNNGSAQPITVSSIGLIASGSGNDETDVDVSLYQDSDADGQIGPSDVLIATGSFANDNGPLSLGTNLALAPGNTISLIVVYEWNNNAEPGNTYALNVDYNTILASAQVVNSTGTIGGNLFTVRTAEQTDTFNSAKPELSTDGVTAAAFSNDEVSNVFSYDAESDPAAFDPNWRNGIVKITGNPTVNPASNIIVTGKQSDNNRLEIMINPDNTFSYRSLDSSVTPVPAFAGTVAISQTPVEIPGTGVFLSFNGSQWTAGDVFRILTWFTEPFASGIPHGAFPARAIAVATLREIAIIDADTHRIWMSFGRHSASTCQSVQQRIYSCHASDLPVSDLILAGGRLFFTINNASSSATVAGGMYVIDFSRDVAFRSALGNSRYFGSATSGTPVGNLRERNSAFTYSNQAAPGLVTTTAVSMLTYYYDNTTSTLITADAEGGTANVVRWGTTVTRTGVAVSGFVRDVAFAPDGTLYFVTSFGGINRSLDYSTIYKTRTISGLTTNALIVSPTGLFIGQPSGIRVLDPVTLNDQTAYSPQGSQNVTSLDWKNDYLFVGSSGESNGSVSVFNTKLNRLSFAYTKEQGLPSNDITSVSASPTSGNFTLAVGTLHSGSAIFQGTLDQVTASTGITVTPKPLFNSETRTPISDAPLIWLEVKNDRATPVTLSSLDVAYNSNVPVPGTAHLYEDVDSSGSVTASDRLLDTKPIHVQTGTLNVNLVQNPGAESALVGGQNPFWTGAGWTRCTGGAFEGAAIFCASNTLPSVEIKQDVDISQYAANIDNGFQSFAFELYLQTLSETIPDTSRVLVEYRDAANTAVLSTYDSGDVVSVGTWTRIANTGNAPVGTRWIRIRFIVTRKSGGGADGKFDSVSLRAIEESNPFVFPANEIITGKQSKSLLVTADLLSGSGTIQASVLKGLDLAASYGLETAFVTGAPITGNTTTYAPSIEITSPAASSTFQEGTQIAIMATARNQNEDVATIDVQVSGVPANQISLNYSPVTPSSNRSVTATLTLPTIAANGSNQVTITVTANDGAAVNSVSIPITLVP